ncbi:hypothetical protein PLESTM_000786000 [Pleodorina starrii]|nr:hypothetical protein PLESTM_000786000 [Pleodorina starrii]
MLRPYLAGDPKYPPRDKNSSPDAVMVNEAGDPYYEVEAILKRNITPVTRKVSYLVKFKGYDVHENLYIDEQTLKAEAPALVAQFEKDNPREKTHTTRTRRSRGKKS